jgi:hypothetical protein
VTQHQADEERDDMTQREILLHVGHGKTGSSFIQSSLALSHAELAAGGITYPISTELAAAGRSGHISSGNLRHAASALTETIGQGFRTGHERVLISSEWLFLALMAELAEELAALPGQYPGARLRVLLYVRDPLDHAVSVYQQMIKRGGYTGSFAESLLVYRIPVKVGQFARAMQAAGAEITVLNYSRHAGSLLHTVEDWLGLPQDRLSNPPVETVNRSMTLAELELQRQFNLLFGKEARRYVSDPLCNRLPQVRSETPTLSHEALAAFLKAMEQMIALKDVAAAVPAAEAYRLPAPDEVAARFAPADEALAFPFAFSAAQLQVIAEAIRGEVQRQVRHGLRKRPSADKS